MELSLNISPCPNDTFMFCGLIHGHVDTEGLEFNVRFEDIETLNSIAFGTRVDIIKISYAILHGLASRYRVLNSGSALGRGNGPLLIHKNDIDLSNKALKVAIPGRQTTANMLMDKLFPQITNKPAYLFSDIAGAVLSDECDAGVLIHEGRFTYEQSGLRLAADMGLLWENQTGLPLPLGAIVVSADMDASIQQKIDRVLHRSIVWARENPSQTVKFVKQHAQEMEDEIIAQHIAMFVNDYSLSLGYTGRKAVRQLTGINDNGIFV